jgi:cyclophilin family peptidyl-prolyl cis-trans isomerase
MPRPAPLLLAGLATAALAVAGCGGGSASTSTSASTPATTTTPAAGCRTVAAPGPKSVDESPPHARLSKGVVYTVTLTTTCGDIPIRLDTARQPRTAASFAHLVRDGVYDELTFHRIVPGFVIQGGDPSGNGTGGPGYTITERPPRDATYTRGVVAMAKTEIERPGTSGSQFFIVVGEDARLPPDYAIVGRVTGDGMRTAERIAAVPTDGQDAPRRPVVIERATLKRG